MAHFRPSRFDLHRPTAGLDALRAADSAVNVVVVVRVVTVGVVVGTASARVL